MDIATAINIKKKKLAYECSKSFQNKLVIRRLKESIARHEKQMEKHNAWKKRHRKRKVINGR